MNSNSESASGTEQRQETHGVGENLVLVSNRQPYRHHYEGDGSDGDGGRSIAVDNPVGGLTAGLDPVMQRLDGTWVAWGDGEADFAVADEDDQVAVPPENPEYTLQRVRLSEDEVRGYYDGYANQALWPLCHTDTCRVRFEGDHWRHYREVNQRFADGVLEHAQGGGTVWFQDYHFALAPRMVKTAEPDAFLMHFYHIPWPAPDVFRICPQRTELLDGLLGNDLLGFHLPRYGTLFMECVEEFLPEATVDWGAGEVHYEDHVTTVRSFPLGVDADDIRQKSEDADGMFEARFRHEHGIGEDVTLALGVDRLDYTKGIPQRLEILEHLFETRPSLRGELTYVQKGCGTRERVPAYQRLRDRIEDEIDRLNERFGTDDWQPIVYTTKMYDHDALCGIYRFSDLALVSPLRDGMNLVAKEYVASQVDDDGVLLLSPLAGAYEELSDGALEFDPYDTAAGADAIERALEMDERERHSRMRTMRRRVHEADLPTWLDDVLETAGQVRATRLEGH
ncbi:trehalose-6-phosphate synthase (plasmid) [Halorarum halophilum]|uniref:Trehalose-6-phosphate synthase n=1 Tax=Halorarum halophilum TaxID=2743090 RepID=A0A7D5KYA9_9EURY|nr:trehalose-6-phosphate synthase [Halobaculum halophilum]QLG29658.1 trehalose-6-phosphate synthase [Halobaculum halophilum]